MASLQRSGCGPVQMNCLFSKERVGWWLIFESFGTSGYELHT